MSAGLTKRESSKHKEPAPHITELLFNNAGRAFKHPAGFNGSIFLNAKEVNSKLYKKILTADPSEKHARLRVSIPLTNNERDRHLPDLRRYFLVGWIPQDPSDFPQTKIKGGTVVGNIRLVEEEIITYDPDDQRLPLMAVIEVKEGNYKDGDPITTFVLLHQNLDTDMCTPYVASADEVF